MPSWRSTAAPHQKRYDDIWFVSPEVGWAVNSEGEILKTADGGDSWELQYHARHAPVWMRSISFATPTRGWVGAALTKKPDGDNDDVSVLFHTRDGENWEPVNNLPPGAPPKICGLCAVDESVVYASGTSVPADGAHVLKTVDGGDSWTAWNMEEHAAILTDIYFPTPDRGWVVGGRVRGGCSRSTISPKGNLVPVILYSEDGGNTWVDQLEGMDLSSHCGSWCWKIQFITESLAVISVQSYTRGVLLKTRDAGGSWEIFEIDDQQSNVNIQGVGFLNEHDGWVGGWGINHDTQGLLGTSSETHDGAGKWHDANDIGRYINRFRFPAGSPKVAYASGQTVYKYSDEPIEAAADVKAQLAEKPPLAKEPPLAKVCHPPIRVELSVAENAERLTIHIWDEFGERVRTLLEERCPVAGPREVEWDGTDAAGQKLSSGVYIVRLVIDGESESRLFWLAG